MPEAMPAAAAIRGVALAAISGVEISMPAMTGAATLGVVVTLAAAAISAAVATSVAAVATSVVVAILAVAAIPRI
jgi:hypothetical protein